MKGIQQYGLLGYPLKNSFSKDYFTKIFIQLGLSHYAYHNFPFQDIKTFPEFLKQHPELKGLNITIPHKQNIIPYLTELDERAKQVGAVNCVRINDDGSTKGYNTDAMALEITLTNMRATNEFDNVLVLGNGGVAKAVCFVLKKLNIPFTIVCRNPIYPAIHFDSLNTDYLKTHPLLINCTPLGMFPDTESKPPIPYELITKKHTLYDLIYLPEETQFLKLGKAKGATTINGLGMLYLQAEESWKIWKKEN